MRTISRKKLERARSVFDFFVIFQTFSLVLATILHGTTASISLSKSLVYIVHIGMHRTLMSGDISLEAAIYDRVTTKISKQMRGIISSRRSSRPSEISMVLYVERQRKEFIYSIFSLCAYTSGAYKLCT